MKTIHTEILHNGQTYANSPKPYSEELYNETCEIARSIAIGEVERITFTIGNKKAYFPRPILQQSIVFVVVTEEESQ